MNDPIQINEHTGRPLNDTWSDYGRRHRWTVVGRVLEDMPAEDHRLLIECRRCGQLRKVWHKAQVVRSLWSWGCPRVPLLYGLWLRLRGKPIPPWSVNEPPPWWTD